jgi:DNA (cytosine-5)-methyltransferase 1
MMSSQKQHFGITEDGISTTLTSQEKERPIVGDTVVRRLTPTECEKLQGFPENWTLIGEYDPEKNEHYFIGTDGKRKKVSDSARYKALGNSIAIPYWFYLLRRIAAQYERPATLGSLFDGISGFCLCWERCNGSGTALWTSEIEEFPIAVAKQHFGDEEAGLEGDIGKYL